MKIVNIVLSGRMSGRIELKGLTNAVYRPSRFSGGVMDHMGCTLLLFENGSFVCLGARSIRQGRECVKSMGEKIGVGVSCCKAKNIVISNKLSFNVNLCDLYNYLRDEKRLVTFENELFNGLSWKENGGTVRLFHTGSYFVTGLNRIVKMKKVCKIVEEICKVYKK